MRIKSILSGSATYLPGVNQILFKRGRSRSRENGSGTEFAMYCYSVWLRHLAMAYNLGVIRTPPRVVAELGPGDSLGTGLAALISGVNTYFAFDVVNHTSNRRNLQVFDELVSLFKEQADMGLDDGFPYNDEHAEACKFPTGILTKKHLESALEDSRIKAIRNALENLDENRGRSDCLAFIVPWNDPSILSKSSVDMIFSHCVLEHVDDLPLTYHSLYQWLKPGGLMSHQIDFSSHGHAKKWNGHWGYSMFIWHLMRGNRPYFINREPHSTHLNLLARHEFEVRCDMRKIETSGICNDELAPEFRSLKKDDIETSTAFMIAVKK